MNAGKKSIHDAPTYTSHKRVRALEINHVDDRLADGGVTVTFADHKNFVSMTLPKIMTARHHPVPGDYLVLYEDGYMSLSPGEAFAGGYLKDVEGSTTQCMDWVDDNGMPAGGSVRGPGIAIEWQNGPLKDDSGKELPRNGAFVLELLAAITGRLEFYQRVADGKFRCRENSLAITKVQEASMWLRERLERRKSEGTLGTHKP